MEHDPLEIWQSVLECLDKGLEAAQRSVGAVKVVALGITNQRETTLVWDRTTGKLAHLLHIQIVTSYIMVWRIRSKHEHRGDGIIKGGCLAGKPLHNAIVWMDRRTAGICQRVTEESGSSVSLMSPILF